MNYIGKKVYGEDGFGGSTGEIVGLEESRWVGTTAIVKWTEGNSAGHEESFALYQLKPISQKCGCGVYIED